LGTETRVETACGAREARQIIHQMPEYPSQLQCLTGVQAEQLSRLAGARRARLQYDPRDYRPNLIKQLPEPNSAGCTR
jgi:hypothetical protein